MLIIRLKRIGKKHQAAFRLVVGERRSKLKGQNTEDLGWFNPHLNKQEFKTERVQYWLSQGVKTSERVHNLLVDSGILKTKKVAAHKQPKKKEGEKPAEAPKA